MNPGLGCWCSLESREGSGFLLSVVVPQMSAQCYFNSPESQIEEMPHEMEQFSIIYVVIIELRELLLPKLRSGLNVLVSDCQRMQMMLL